MDELSRRMIMKSIVNEKEIQEELILLPRDT
jgi:hypothetical protein